MNTTDQWIYRKHPVGMIGVEHFERVTVPLQADLAQDEVIVESRYISVDPYMRVFRGVIAPFGVQSTQIDKVQRAGVVGQVVISNSAYLQDGDWVFGMLGWQTRARMHSSELQKLDPQVAPVTTALGVLGMPGRTAWFGLTDVGRPRTGDIVVVSGAGGAVGSLVVQYAKRYGCKVMAIAGGFAKCMWLTERLGADWAIDYKEHRDAASLSRAIKSKIDGVDVYFDNVGGMVSDAVFPMINPRARIVLCGQISQYSGKIDEPESGPRFLHHLIYNRARIEGILASDYAHRMDEMLRIVGPWVRDRQIVFEETIVEGFERLPAMLGQLFSGEHRGKLLIKV